MPLISAALPSELDWLVSQAAVAGWNPGLSDSQLFWHLDPNGFLSIKLEGHFVRGGTVVRHSHQYGFMGLFFIDQQHRRKGLGKIASWARRDHLVGRLTSDAPAGLDAVNTMVHLHAQGGSQAETRHRRFRQAPAPASSPEVQILPRLPADHHWLPREEISAAKVAEIDRQCFPAERTTFHYNWLTQPACLALSVTPGHRACGYGVARRSVTGFKTGPLFAETPVIAATLLTEFRRSIADAPLSFDAPDTNLAAAARCRESRMPEVSGCLRMSPGLPPQVHSERISGNTTLEIE